MPPSGASLRANVSYKVVSSGEIALREVGESGQLDPVAIDRLAHARTGENFDFVLRPRLRRYTANVGRRMEIQLGGAVAKPLDHADDIVLVEMTARREYEQRVGRAESALGHHPVGPPRQGAENSPLEELARHAVAIESKRRHHTFARETKIRNFVLDGKVDQNVGEDRMDMKIQMSVDMVEIADQFEMPFGLRAKFVGHFGAHRTVEEVTHPREHGILDEAPRRIDRTAKPPVFEDAPALANDRMQADVECWIMTRQFSSRPRRRLSDHQARAAQDSVAMRSDNAGVDLGRQSEVVGIDDQALQSPTPPRTAGARDGFELVKSTHAILIA